MKDTSSTPTPSFGNIDRLLEEIDNKYLLVNVARVRAQQLVNGIEPLVEGSNPEKAVTTAFAEIRAGKLEVDIGVDRPPRK